MTQIRLHDSRSRSKRPFVPIDPQNVRMYVCGPTVYDRAHLGNARPVVVFDLLYRLLRHVYGPGHVTYVRNFTDIDDKIIVRAEETGRPIAQITEETTRWYLEDMAALGALEPDHMPRATAYIGEMREMIAELIARGHAYEAAGHVLFSVESWRAGYGRLSGRSLDDMIAGARVEVAPYKRDPMDFVLWKPSDEDQPGWDSPWGRGRPGWHIECSAMSLALLGASFDIHGGGNDLMFPHHENEIAQSCCAHPQGEFARYWLHNEMLQVEGKKMSKSLGNFFTVRDLLELYREEFAIDNIGPAIRYRFLEVHYRSPIDASRSHIEAAATKLGSWWFWLSQHLDTFDVDPNRRAKILESSPVVDALKDDLNSSKALSEIDAMVKELRQTPANHTYIDDFSDRQEDTAVRVLVNLQFLGFNLEELKELHQSQWSERLKNRTAETDRIEGLIAARQEARAAKNFARADQIRMALQAAGVTLIDTPEGTTWEAGPGFDPAQLKDVK